MKLSLPARRLHLKKNQRLMIELVLSKIKVDETRNEQVIILREKQGSRFLPVVIGMPEVNAIKLKLSGVVPPRPLAHDLMVQIIEKLGARLIRITIDKLEQQTFYAKLVLKREGGGEEITVDARPSDSVALALRTGAPIFASEDVVSLAGVQEI
ncbi:MAG: bifunctional nuclease family protein [Candidatus Omnitrophica bacterium]|nr:bifunctional nuclease family protein [Candidatus Omnitrophota bacterium]